jgi:hypothetical protein
MDFDDFAGLQWYAYRYNYFPLLVMNPKRKRAVKIERDYHTIMAD